MSITINPGFTPVRGNFKLVTPGSMSLVEEACSANAVTATSTATPVQQPLRVRRSFRKINNIYSDLSAPSGNNVPASARVANAAGSYIDSSIVVTYAISDPDHPELGEKLVPAAAKISMSLPMVDLGDANLANLLYSAIGVFIRDNANTTTADPTDAGVGTAIKKKQKGVVH